MDGTETATPIPAQGFTALDAAMLARLAAVVDEATGELDSYDHARALEVTESFFWSYCDDYLELVKSPCVRRTRPSPVRLRPERRWRLSLSVMLRLFAPFLPYCSEEAWSWWQEGSIHLSPWPSGAALAGAAGPGAQPDLLEAVAEVLVAVRRAKTEAKGSMRRPRWHGAW